MTIAAQLMYLSDRRPVICPFTGLTAKYRHPSTMIPYATLAEFKQIEALLANRYVWSTGGGCWLGGEEDVCADGMEGIEGWKEAVHGGWLGGHRLSALEKTTDMFVDESGIQGMPAKRRKSSISVSNVDEDHVSRLTKPYTRGKGKGKRKS